MPPKPPKQTRPTPKFKPPHIPKSEGSLDQLQRNRNVGELDKLGIGLLPPKKEDLRRLIDKQKNQVTVPQEPTPGTVPLAGPGPDATRLRLKPLSRLKAT